MPERVQQGALEHVLDWARSNRRIFMFGDRTSLGCSRSQSVLVHREGVVYESSILTVVKPTEAGLRVP